MIVFVLRCCASELTLYLFQWVFFLLHPLWRLCFGTSPNDPFRSRFVSFAAASLPIALDMICRIALGQTYCGAHNYSLDDPNAQCYGLINNHISKWVATNENGREKWTGKNNYSIRDREIDKILIYWKCHGIASNQAIHLMMSMIRNKLVRNSNNNNGIINNVEIEFVFFFRSAFTRPSVPIHLITLILWSRFSH